MSSYAPGTGPGSIPEPPNVEVPPANFAQVGKEIGVGVKESGLQESFFAALGNSVLEMLHGVVQALLKLFLPILLFLARQLLELRKDTDKSVAELASVGVSDLFGVDVAPGAFSRLGPRAERAQVASLVGDQILRGVTGEVAGALPGPIQPSDAPARRYMGTMADLAVEGWFEGFICDLFSEHPFEKLGELKDSVVQVFGLGRLTRRVIGPAVDILVGTPYKWKLNKDYRPTLLSAPTLVRQFNRGRITVEQLNEELARQGYSNDRIEALINESSKFLSVSDLSFLERNGYWPRDLTVEQMVAQGYTVETADQVLNIAMLQRLDSAKNDYLSAAITSYVQREIDDVTLGSVMQRCGVPSDVREFLKLSAGHRREFNISLLTMSEAEQAVERGFWTLRQFTDYLKHKGFSDDDVLTKQLLLQDKIRVDVAAQKKREQAEATRAADRAARKAEALARQQELEAQRARKELTLAQVQTAYVRGRISQAQLADYLASQKIAPSDIQLLLDLSDGDRQDYDRAQFLRNMADSKLASTSLNTAQLEKAVELGDLSVADWDRILTEQGVGASDLALLHHQLVVNLAERKDAQARRAAIEAKLQVKGLTLVQVEQAVRRGLQTMADYKAFLKDQGYGPEDQGVLAGLLQGLLDDDAAARKRRDDIAAAMTAKRISLADMERAVRRKLRPISDYRSLLVANGIVPGDVDTLVSLLQGQIDDETAAAARKAEIEANLGVHRVAVADVARAVKLGLIDINEYTAALDREKMPRSDQAVMLALLQTDIADAAAAKAARAAAEEKTKNKPVPLADVAKAVRQGLRTVSDYKAAVLREGFTPDAADLMGSLLQDELDQLEAAKARRAELDAKKAEPELTRAELEKAIKKGVRQEPDYRQYLVDHGYSPIDVITLERLLLSEMGL